MRRLLPALLAAALFAGACGGGDNGDDSGSDTTAAGATTTALAIQTAAPTTAPPVDEFDPEGTLRVAYSVGPVSFDPAKSSSSFDSPALFITYDRLVHLDPNASVVPGLAESWEFSADGLSMTLKLREGVEFHDGGTLDAEAAKISLERNKAGTAAGELAPVTAIEVVDPLTLKLTFTKPSAQFPAILADRAGIVINPAKKDDPGLDLQPSGAGMYRVVEYVKDSKIVYEAFEGYWDKDAQKAKRIEFQIIQDNNALFNALKGDQIDWGLLTPQQVEEAKSSGLVVEEDLSLNLFHVQLNRSRPFFDKLEVRQALSMAIDREGIAEGVLLGKAAATCQPFPNGYWGHNPDVQIPEYNPEKAREMLRAAGVPEGQQYEMVVPNTGSYPAMAEAVKAMWAEVGVVANIRIVDSVQTAPIFYANQEGDVLLSVFGGRFDPAQHFNLLYTAGPIQNPGQGTWPAMDAAIAQVSTPGTQEARTPAVQEASRIVCDDALNLVYVHPASIFAYNDKVLGSVNWLIGRPEFRGMGVKKG